MKNISVTDETYELLMNLSKELQTQDNNHEAFPVAWMPSSEKLELNYNDEGNIAKVNADGDTDLQDLEDFAESDEYKLYNEFLSEKNNYCGESIVGGDCFDLNNYCAELENDWLYYIRNKLDDVRILTYDYERQREYIPSIFKSDVTEFCKHNKHRLGRDPKPYSENIFRMPKMRALILAVCNFNKDVPEDEINDETGLYLTKRND